MDARFVISILLNNTATGATLVRSRTYGPVLKLLLAMLCDADMHVAAGVPSGAAQREGGAAIGAAGPSSSGCGAAGGAAAGCQAAAAGTLRPAPGTVGNGAARCCLDLCYLGCYRSLCFPLSPGMLATIVLHTLLPAESTLYTST
jgi:hypothetical protein